MRFLTVAGLRRRSLVAVAAVACLGSAAGGCASDATTAEGETSQLGNVMAGGTPAPTANTTTDGLDSVNTGSVIEGPGATGLGNVSSAQGGGEQTPAERAEAQAKADDAPEGSYLFDFLGIPRDEPRRPQAAVPVDGSDPDAFPNLATVPGRPDRPRTALEREDVTQGLQGDLQNARHTDQDLRGGIEPEAAPPRPLATAPDPLAGPASGASSLDSVPGGLADLPPPADPLPADPPPVEAAPAEAPPVEAAMPDPLPEPAPLPEAVATPAPSSGSYLSGSMLSSPQGRLRSSYTPSLLSPMPPPPAIGAPVPAEPAPFPPPADAAAPTSSDIGAPVEPPPPEPQAALEAPAADLPPAEAVQPPLAGTLSDSATTDAAAAQALAAAGGPPVAPPDPAAGAPVLAGTLAPVDTETVDAAAARAVAEAAAATPPAPAPSSLDSPTVADALAPAAVASAPPAPAGAPPVGRTVEEITATAFAASGTGSVPSPDQPGPQVAMITGAGAGGVNPAALPPALPMGQPAAVIEFFEGSNRLSAKDQERLQEAYLAYLRGAARIRVVGRTGPGDGEGFDAFAVGLKRAEAVAQQLITLGVPPASVVVEAKPGEGRKAQVYIE
ncbi:hypothetical protein [Zavarzinia sp. CC-PAN008]|uniref:hypothetical protein n=1 Tax=Zavarzinia sp. CC-PAN008 TaxID=3243332 RepID=UPI003F74440F